MSLFAVFFILDSHQGTENVEAWHIASYTSEFALISSLFASFILISQIGHRGPTNLLDLFVHFTSKEKEAQMQARARQEAAEIAARAAGSQPVETESKEELDV